jgi:hypothetical protein
MKAHPFFAGLNWSTIRYSCTQGAHHYRDVTHARPSPPPRRSQPPPYDPNVKSIDDTSNFDEFPDEDPDHQRMRFTGCPSAGVTLAAFYVLAHMNPPAIPSHPQQ